MSCPSSRRALGEIAQPALDAALLFLFLSRDILSSFHIVVMVMPLSWGPPPSIPGPSCPFVSGRTSAHVHPIPHRRLVMFDGEVKVRRLLTYVSHQQRWASRYSVLPWPENTCEVPRWPQGKAKRRGGQRKIIIIMNNHK